MPTFDLKTRASGVLLHITSLPGPHFNGDLGSEAYAFIDWLAAAGQRFWQVLPVNPIGAGFSPYATVSSFAGEPLLINLNCLQQAGLLRKKELADASGANANKVHYRKALRFRYDRLRLAFSRWQGDDDAMQSFRESQAHWLDDFTLYQALATKLGSSDFTRWPAPLRERRAADLEAARSELADEIAFLEFTQWQFQQQWSALRAYAHRQGVGLIGDLPIFVAASSADVWAHRQVFFLDAAGRPTVVAGCPPDSFNKDGQLWGNALYDWDHLAASGFAWWLERFARVLGLFDAVRLDHFIGFHRYWQIPAKAKTARNGKWMPARGDELFAMVQKRLGDQAAFIAEDLGAVTPEVRALRDKYHFPGIKVLQFAFDGTEEARHHMPHCLPQQAVVYTGTHDNHTTRGYFDNLKARASRKDKPDKKAREELARLNTYLGTKASRVHADLMRAGMQSQASLVITPMQDLLGQGDKERMNIPGKGDGNWTYRVRAEALSSKRAAGLRFLTELYDRHSL